MCFFCREDIEDQYSGPRNFLHPSGALLDDPLHLGALGETGRAAPAAGTVTTTGIGMTTIGMTGREGAGAGTVGTATERGALTETLTRIRKGGREVPASKRGGALVLTREAEMTRPELHLRRLWKRSSRKTVTFPRPLPPKPKLQPSFLSHFLPKSSLCAASWKLY